MDAIEAKGVSLKYRICREKPSTIKGSLFNVFINRHPNHDLIWALKGVDLNVKKGEIVGLIGKNGCGKTTFLKIIAGILTPDSGTVLVKGRVSPMLSIGVGFQPELTGRENIFLSGSIFGLSKNEMQEKLGEIVAFSELENFIDIPVRHYSTGMYMRLGFSVAVSVDPDILLIDEVMAVGDEGFQAKCYQKMEDFERREKTIIFVSHNLDIISKISHRLVLLEDGKIKAIGNPSEIIDLYRRELAVNPQ
jgi:ABC-type polysaccharide/polyol phosphate transport system ATPase subunit